MSEEFIVTKEDLEKIHFDLNKATYFKIKKEKDCCDWWAYVPRDIQNLVVQLAIYLNKQQFLRSRKERFIAIPMIQRKLRLKYSEAKDFMDKLESLGIIEKQEGSKPAKLVHK